MQFKQIPPDYASLRHPLIYTVTDTAPRTFDIQIIDLGYDQTVGAKRITGVASAEIDAAPFLRRGMNFRPKTGPTGFIPSLERIVIAQIAVDGLFSPARTFLPAEQVPQRPALLTTCGLERLIGPAACDELMILTDTPCRITLQVRRGATQTTTTYSTNSAGPTLFRLNTADFQEANTLILIIEGIGRVTYNIEKLPGGRRIAWRSRAGSVEHYTFPLEEPCTPQVERATILTATGPRTTALECRRTAILRSAYEPVAMLGSLAEVLSAPEVWYVDDDGTYQIAEVMNNDSGIRTHGTLRNLELCIRLAPETLIP